MASNVAVLFFSFSTILFAISAFIRIEANSVEEALLSLVVGGLLWAAGAIAGYLFQPLREAQTVRAQRLRLVATVGFALAMIAFPLVASAGVQHLLGGIVFFLSGLLIPSVIDLNSEDAPEMREAFTKGLVGSAIGSFFSALLYAGAEYQPWLINTSYGLAATSAFMAPLIDYRLYFSENEFRRRWILMPFVLITFGIAPFLGDASGVTATSQAEHEADFATDAVYRFKPERKFDVYMMGSSASWHAEQMSATIREASVRSLTTQNVNGRRNLAAEARRFDLIQIFLPSGSADSATGKLDLRAEGALTVEALRVYFDRLKDEGFLQIVGSASPANAQTILATIAEAWKKSARRDVDLYAMSVTDKSSKALSAVIIRMKPLQREERDAFGRILQTEQTGPREWMLVSDASGAVLTDDQPLVRTSVSMNMPTFLGGLLMVMGLILWVSVQERRKELASRWQTASLATYFSGLGFAFAFFQVFFVMRALRNWGAPWVAVGLVMTVLFVSRAAGSTFFAGHVGRRYGVRIQPLANFVFGVMFTYLGAALFEPLVRSGSIWLTAFVGMSVLIPFGLLGGAFLPNALEEAADKLPPRVLSLLWALYAAGTAIGIYAAAVIGFENGLDIVFLAGLFCFAWVAIFSGLLRPWNVRKRG